uniref:BUB1 N-terminal domain-containing protein n=1 Tax=Panagrolaimus superbus TaxID=310955 RepID=A0A914XX10_9BILA
MSTESTTTSIPSEPTRQLDWFDNIENIRPTRSGHSAAAVLAAATAPVVTINEAREKFTNAMKEAETAVDPLTTMVQFVKWFDDHFLSGKTSVLHPMLYQILTKYGTERRYRNDERIMKLWLRLADNFPERGFAVMQLACSRGSCKELAKFYIFWSRMYEYAEQMDRAREILRRGIFNRATPITELNEATDALEVRILRWTMEKEKRQAELDLSDDDYSNMEDTRRMFGQIEVEETERGYRAPTVRTDTSTPKKLNIRAPIKADFDVYVEEEEEESSSQNSNWSIPKVEEELSSDPDWQSIFGYQDTPGIHLDITENTVTHKGGIIKVKPSPEQPLAAFSVYCETQKTKLKFAVRRELVYNCSIEEAYVQQLLQNDGKDDCQNF